ncbi:MAG: DUF1294 domain-containing protein [Bacillaceae bacterium]|nr:DUF1294 domain-containing protein [Bacillaceae bacterium]
MDSIFLILIVLNLIGFLNMGWDKRQAKKGNWRTPESRFFLLAVFGAALGIYIGMNVFRHKTRHRSFRIIMPALIVVHMLILYFLVEV